MPAQMEFPCPIDLHKIKVKAVCNKFRFIQWGLLHEFSGCSAQLMQYLDYYYKLTSLIRKLLSTESTLSPLYLASPSEA